MGRPARKKTMLVGSGIGAAKSVGSGIDVARVVAEKLAAPPFARPLMVVSSRV